MFTEMVSLLKAGEMHDLVKLRQRFERALVKKIGVINTPYSFWSSDPKINPLTKELIWAAILLEDIENFNLLLGIIAAEAKEKNHASGQNKDIESPADYKNIVEAYIQELIELTPTEKFCKVLTEKVDKITI